MTYQDSFHHLERCQGERLFHTVTEKAFDLAHKLDTRELDDGVTKYLAINQLRIVELYRVPATALERFSARLCAIPGAAL